MLKKTVRLLDPNENAAYYLSMLSSEVILVLFSQVKDHKGETVL